MNCPPHIIRPIRESDLEDFSGLVGNIADGMTSLPNNPDFLLKRIHHSLHSFYPEIHKPGGEYYLFVLEDLKTNRVIGTSGILARVGGYDPFYTYKIVREPLRYTPLAIDTCIESLHLVKNHKGPSEICSLYLNPEYRSCGLGKLLSLVRIMFNKSFSERFDEEIITELRGYINDLGKVPFWEAVGKKFFQNDYSTADILSGLGEKEFIETLMPKYPIYMSLLPSDAREVIGQVHPHTAPARRLLLQEGFCETDEIDIFDAGPLLRAHRNSLKTWKSMREATAVSTPHLDEGTRTTAILSNGRLDFRACLASIVVSENATIQVSPDILNRLNLENEKVCYVTL